VWNVSTLNEQQPDVYLAKPEVPNVGWRAFLVELVYDRGGPAAGMVSPCFRKVISNLLTNDDFVSVNIK